MIDTNLIITELENRFFDIPFENSNFQNETFFTAAQLTPARAYRAIGLRMFSKIQAIKELKYGRQLEEVEIEEQQAIINNPESTIFERRKAQIEIDKRQSTHGYTDKLLNDAIHELNFLYAKLQEFPAYNREQFELEEKEHFTRRMHLQQQVGSGLEPLYHIDHIDEFNRVVRQAKESLDMSLPDATTQKKQLEGALDDYLR